jgi:hypothetical protein
MQRSGQRVGSQDGPGALGFVELGFGEKHGLAVAKSPALKPTRAATGTVRSRTRLREATDRPGAASARGPTLAASHIGVYAA